MNHYVIIDDNYDYCSDPFELDDAQYRLIRECLKTKDLGLTEVTISTAVPYLNSIAIPVYINNLLASCPDVVKQYNEQLVKDEERKKKRAASLLKAKKKMYEKLKKELEEAHEDIV